MNPTTQAAFFDELEKIAFTLRDVGVLTGASALGGGALGYRNAKKNGTSKLKGALKGGAIGASIPVGLASGLIAAQSY